MTNLDSLSDEASPTWGFGRFSRRCTWLQKFTISQLVKSFETYQPVTLNGLELKRGARDCAERWQMMASAFQDADVNSVLDLGCAEGYFIRCAVSARKCVALGVDADVRRVTIAQSIAMYEGISGLGFIHANITPEFVAKLPAFDAIIFLSVLHHVMHQRGIDNARRLMELLRERTRKTLIFDMGQSNETQYSWAKTLPAMEPDPITWISAFLKQCGFSSVEVLGETEGFGRIHRRALFMAIP